MNATPEKIAKYAAALTQMDADQLMDALVRASGADQYGSHTQQIEMIRAEIRTRIDR